MWLYTCLCQCLCGYACFACVAMHMLVLVLHSPMKRDLWCLHVGVFMHVSVCVTHIRVCVCVCVCVCTNIGCMDHTGHIVCTHCCCLDFPKYLVYVETPHPPPTRSRSDCITLRRFNQKGSCVAYVHLDTWMKLLFNVVCFFIFTCYNKPLSYSFIHPVYRQVEIAHGLEHCTAFFAPCSDASLKYGRVVWICVGMLIAPASSLKYRTGSNFDWGIICSRHL